jgi:hypothetical protein
MQGPRSDLPERYERDGEVTQLLQAKGCSLLRAPGGLPSGCVSGTTSMSFPISEVRSSLAVVVHVRLGNLAQKTALGLGVGCSTAPPLRP